MQRRGVAESLLLGDIVIFLAPLIIQIGDGGGIWGLVGVKGVSSEP